MRQSKQVRDMTVKKIPGEPAPSLTERADYLISMAARAPSVHNTQPWRFKVSEQAVEVYADTSRKLHADPLGREMLISCGAAVFGLRLGLRSLGYLPVADLLPDPARLRLLARVRLAGAAPMTAAERTMLEAVPHRHTHRGPFEPTPLPAGLLAGLQHDAMAEGATLALTDQHTLAKLVEITGPAGRTLDQARGSRADVLRWTREAGDPARDGIPAHAFADRRAAGAGRLRQRDFDLGRGIGLLAGGGSSPPATAVLLTPGDNRADWLRAGQALYRLLLHAASRWVFAALYTQPLEAAATRKLIKTSLALPGSPQLLLELGVTRTSQATARRPARELLEP
jgi:hypothetical protein